MTVKTPSPVCPGAVLCAIGDVPPGTARAVQAPGIDGRPLSVVVARTRDGTVRAYRNLCPHFGVRLDVRPDYRFLDDSGQLLVCQVHYARFALEDGRCVRGDCEGEYLEPVPVEAAGGCIRTPLTGRNG